MCMSRSDLAAAVSLLDRLADADDMAPDDVKGVVSAATRLYANACTRAGEELPPLTEQISTTDAITLACALLRSQDLTPFDMAMWFSRGKTHG
jgi:hypothetical protein